MQRRSLTVEELARAQGVRPVKDVRELACPGLFESDEELTKFLDFTQACRAGSTAPGSGELEEGGPGDPSGSRARGQRRRSVRAALSRLPRVRRRWPRRLLP